MDALVVVAFTISVGLAGLEVWRTFGRKPNLEAIVEWTHEDKALDGISFYVVNTGHRKTVLAKAGVRCADDEGPQHYRSHMDVFEKLPIVLDVDKATPRLIFPVREYMREGRARAVVIEDHKRNVKELALLTSMWVTGGPHRATAVLSDRSRA